MLLLLAPVALLAAVSWHRAAPLSGLDGGGHEAGLPDARVNAQPLIAARRPVETRAASAVRPGLPLNRRAGFEAEDDLYGYAQTLTVAARNGDAEANWMLSRVYDYCAGYAIDPLNYDADSRALAGLASPGVAAMQAARDRVSHRCTGFGPVDGLTGRRLVGLRSQAAKDGNLAAEAALLSLGQPLDASAGYRRELVQRVLDSRDPEAYLALSSAMGAAANGDDAYRGLVAGDQFAELAWQVAACQLGLDCSPGSALMTSYCANGGICSQDASQDFSSFVLDAAVPRQGARKMDEMVNALISGAGEAS
ncbi:MAG TPA: hypothetical protein VGC74_16025 [Stenotrophomonas sp.]|jgi:hypothetical protein